MSKNGTPNEEATKEKVVTKYDLKMERRAKEKAQAKREELYSKLLGWVIVLAVFAFVVSFPIRSYLTVNGKFIEIGGQSVNRVEFDYQYNITKNNYIDQYSYYMSMFGIDLSGDLSTMAYSETLTWQDYFQQMTSDALAKNKALYAEAQSKGFTYDTTAEYEQLVKSIRDAAKQNNMTEKQYVAACYGQYATLSRLKKYIEQDLYVNAYYDQLTDEMKPTDEEVQAKYDEDPTAYDSVDYRLVTVSANLPTEPTELADPVEETDEETDEETTYTPSEAEVAYAMMQAKAEAEERKSEVNDASIRENCLKSSMSSVISDWLFADGRKAGDTTILENEDGNCYYIVRFEKRYQDETLSKNARIIIVTDGTAQSILDEWQSGAATEESFAEIADKYNDLTVTSAKGGLYEALEKDNVPVGMDEWLFSDERNPGDVTIISEDTEETEEEATEETEEEVSYSYICYYVGDNLPAWKLGISNTLQSDSLNAHIEEIKAAYTVNDPKGNLNYLKVQASEEAAAAAEAEAAEAEESTEE